MAKKMKNPSMGLALPELPEDIQRRIILSLPPKAFARSSILSKSWLSFFNSNRYSCSFHFNFQLGIGRVPKELPQEIIDFDKKLSADLLRENLTVEEFNINIPHFSDKLTDLLYKWFAALFTRNNIVKVLQIQIRKSWDIGNFYFPQEIFYKVFSHGSLQVLHLECNCILDRLHPRNLGCLRVLSLRNVFIDGKSTNRLLSACPILEQLTLLNVLRGQYIIIKGLHKLKDLDIRGFVDVRIQEAPALENVSFEAYNDDRTIINAQACRRIKLLTMFVNSERTARHIQQIVSCLPALENLTLTMLCATDIIISSLCLKNLQLFISEDQDLKMVKIKAPNLRCYEYGSDFATFSQQLVMKTVMLEMVEINLMNIEIDEPGDVLELRKALRMIEHLKLGVDTVKLLWGQLCIKASRLDEKFNVSATRVIEMLDAMLDAGAVKFDVDGNFCF